MMWFGPIEFDPYYASVMDPRTAQCLGNIATYISATESAQQYPSTYAAAATGTSPAAGSSPSPGASSAGARPDFPRSLRERAPAYLDDALRGKDPKETYKNTEIDPALERSAQRGNKRAKMRESAIQSLAKQIADNVDTEEKREAFANGYHDITAKGGDVALHLLNALHPDTSDFDSDEAKAVAKELAKLTETSGTAEETARAFVDMVGEDAVRPLLNRCWEEVCRRGGYVTVKSDSDLRSALQTQGYQSDDADVVFREILQGQSPYRREKTMQRLDLARQMKGIQDPGIRAETYFETGARLALQELGIVNNAEREEYYKVGLQKLVTKYAEKLKDKAKPEEVRREAMAHLGEFVAWAAEQRRSGKPLERVSVESEARGVAPVSNGVAGNPGRGNQPPIPQAMRDVMLVQKVIKNGTVSSADLKALQRIAQFSTHPKAKATAAQILADISGPPKKEEPKKEEKRTEPAKPEGAGMSAPEPPMSRYPPKNFSGGTK